VEVSLAARGADLELTVSDDGSGLDLAAARLRGADRPSLGLVSMRERAALVGGRLEISRTEEGGTRVQAVLPLRFRDAGEDAPRP
jgi:two-component system sensor histidine kinase UhpB